MIGKPIVCAGATTVTPVLEAFDPHSSRGPPVIVGPPLPEIGPFEPQPPAAVQFPLSDHEGEAAGLKLKTAMVSKRLMRPPPPHATRRLTTWPSAAATRPSAVIVNDGAAPMLKGSTEVPTMNNCCVGFPDASFKTTVEAVPGAAPVAVGQ